MCVIWKQICPNESIRAQIVHGTKVYRINKLTYLYYQNSTIGLTFLLQCLVRECDVFFNFKEDSFKINLMNKLILSHCDLLFVIHPCGIIYKVFISLDRISVRDNIWYHFKKIFISLFL